MLNNLSADPARGGRREERGREEGGREGGREGRREGREWLKENNVIHHLQFFFELVHVEQLKQRGTKPLL